VFYSNRVLTNLTLTITISNSITFTVTINSIQRLCWHIF